jgi:hypothetical protein
MSRMSFRRHSQSEPEESLFRRAARWPVSPALESLTETVLRQVTNDEGVDFATALLSDRFRRDPRHAAFIRRIDALRQSPAMGSEGTDVKVAIVPGALYAERPDLGGDGRLVREIAERFGLRSVVVSLASLGSISENALRLNGWMAQHSGERLILVSLSKGGADLKMALASPDALHLYRNVIAWVNVCGPLDGAAMVNWILSSRLRTWLVRLQYRLQRRDFRFVTELGHGHGAPLDFPLRLPEGMKLVNLVGFPLNRHMSTAFSRFCHRTLSAWGPNDGTVLLADVSKWPGDTYPVWGVDHYFRPESTARTLIAAVLGYLTETAGTLTPAHHPIAASP